MSTNTLKLFITAKIFVVATIEFWKCINQYAVYNK